MKIEADTTSALAIETGQEELPQVVDGSAAESALPVHEENPCERADAARNRKKILVAAEQLFEQLGTENVSMDAVAAAAGVGKGTLYRRFGDRSGLARAILDEHEREFQESIIRGEPPLGPGAPPAERLIAFGNGVMGMLEKHGDLILAAQSGAIGARFSGPVYATYRFHVLGLLRELNPDIDVEYFADVLLAALSAEMVNYWRGEVGIPDQQLARGFESLIRVAEATAACPK